jgi:hypothetical protein
VLAGYRVLEQREFLPVVGSLALIHLLTVFARAPRLSWHLFVSQTLIVVVTLSSVVLHTWHAVGPAPLGWSRTLGSFLQAALTSPSTYLHFGGYLVAFCLVLAGVLLVIRVSRLRSAIDLETVLVAAYVTSSVNVAFDYSLTRPLYHVGGEPDAVAFFFTAGLFGVEFSLPLHLLLLLACVVWKRLIHRPARVPGEPRRSSAPTAVPR